MNVECHDSSLLGRTDCYNKVIRETCNTSAADENMLQTVMYNAKLSLIGRHGLCPVGKSYNIGNYCFFRTVIHVNMYYIRDRNFLTSVEHSHRSSNVTLPRFKRAFTA